MVVEAPRDCPMFIDGASVQASSGAWLEVRSPATGALVGRVPAGTEADVDRAVAAARAAFDDGRWGRRDLPELTAILLRLADLTASDRTMAAARSPEEEPATVPPITELTRIEPIHLQRLAHQGVFTTGLLLEVSETGARRQTLADQVQATPNDVLAWRDEVLLLNLAGFGAAEHAILRFSGIDGLGALLAIDLATFRAAVGRAAGQLGVEPPGDRMTETWWDQARTLEDE
ncbi:MAG: aldehyde dehydrogenase family protein [Chloroflexota bacterium]